MGGVLIILLCLGQTDLKSLIAYPPVAHMGFVLGEPIALSYWRLYGPYSLIIAHVLCLSGLFCLANITYMR